MGWAMGVAPAGTNISAVIAVEAAGAMVPVLETTVPAFLNVTVQPVGRVLTDPNVPV